MVFAKRWYRIAIICTKENKFYRNKKLKKVEVVYVTTSSYNFYLTLL